jgi:hypothetical protein
MRIAPSPPTMQINGISTAAMHAPFLRWVKNGSCRSAVLAAMFLNQQTLPTPKSSRSMSEMDDAAGTAAHTRSRVACAFSRMAESDIAGVSASGSTLTCRIAGRPELRAASKAVKKSAVRSTVAPWPPKARA